MSIYKHKHHIIPRHMGGSNDPSNLVELTVEEHAEAHRVLYETYGSEYDRIAYKALTGQIGKEEARILAAIEHNKGKVASAETRAKQSAAAKGKKKSPTAARNSALARTGLKRSEEAKKNMSEAATQNRDNLVAAGKAAKGIPKPTLRGKTRPKIQCEGCGKWAQKSAITRWHKECI